MLTYKDFKQACDFAVDTVGIEGAKQMSWFGKWSKPSSNVNKDAAPQKEAA